MIKNSIELPFECIVFDTEPVMVTNPFSGEGVMLEPEAVAVYDIIKGAEMLGDRKTMVKGMEWFLEHFPEEYMVLLD